MYQVNFLPWRKQQYKKVIRCFVLLFLLYGSIAFLSLFGVYFSALNQNQRLSEKLLVAQSNYGLLLKQLNHIQQVRDQINQREQYVNDITLMKHSAWNKHSLLLHIEKTLSNAIWLKTITIEQGKLAIDGEGAEYGPIIDFYQKTSHAPFISNLQLGKVAVTGAGVYSFSLTADWSEANGRN